MQFLLVYDNYVFEVTVFGNSYQLHSWNNHTSAEVLSQTLHVLKEIFVHLVNNCLWYLMLAY